jgi:hypothetical protein
MTRKPIVPKSNPRTTAGHESVRRGKLATGALAATLLLAACSDKYTGPDAQPYSSYNEAKVELAKLDEKYDGYTSNKPEGEMEAALRGALPLFISNTDKTAQELANKFGQKKTVLLDAETGATVSYLQYELQNGQVEDSFEYERGSEEDGVTEWVNIRRDPQDDSVVQVSVGSSSRSPDHFGEPIPYASSFHAHYRTDGTIDASTFTRPIREADEDILEPIVYGGVLTSEGFEGGRSASLESLQFSEMFGGMDEADSLLAAIDRALSE